MTRCAVKDCVNPTIQGKRCCFWHSDNEQDYEDALKDTWLSILLARKTIRDWGM